jgi:hypothetical protein
VHEAKAREHRVETKHHVQGVRQLREMGGYRLRSNEKERKATQVTG